MISLPLRVGVIGCGNISDTYFRNASLFAGAFRIVACADRVHAAAEAKAAEWQVAALSPEALMSDPAIDVVLNLTVPAAHLEVSSAALRAGKHVYSEKPLTLTATAADTLASLAAAQGLQVAAAPDTILGAATQAALAAIRSGAIGRVVGAHAAIMDRGMEEWHPNPDFFFQPGGGPVMDMGPYYLASLIALLGPVSGVTSIGMTGLPERVIGNGPRAGQSIAVAVPTSVRALLRFQGGADAVFQASWDIWTHGLPHIEIYGTEGTLSLPDPNWFDGVPMLSVRGAAAVPLGLSGFALNKPNRTLSDSTAVADYRGAGLADLCTAIVEGRTPRLGLHFARHLTEVLEKISRASSQTTPMQHTDVELRALLTSEVNRWE